MGVPVAETSALVGVSVGVSVGDGSLVGSGAEVWVCPAAGVGESSSLSWETTAIAMITAAVPTTAPPTAYSQLRPLLLRVLIGFSLRVRDRMAVRPSAGSTESAACEISSESRASYLGSRWRSSVMRVLQMG